MESLAAAAVQYPGRTDFPDEESSSTSVIPSERLSRETWENKKEHKFTPMTKERSICYGSPSTVETWGPDQPNLDRQNIANSDHYEEWQSRLRPQVSGDLVDFMVPR